MLISTPCAALVTVSHGGLQDVEQTPHWQDLDSLKSIKLLIQVYGFHWLELHKHKKYGGLETQVRTANILIIPSSEPGGANIMFRQGAWGPMGLSLARAAVQYEWLIQLRRCEQF